MENGEEFRAVTYGSAGELQDALLWQLQNLTWGVYEHEESLQSAVNHRHLRSTWLTEKEASDEASRLREVEGCTEYEQDDPELPITFERYFTIGRIASKYEVHATGDKT